MKMATSFKISESKNKTKQKIIDASNAIRAKYNLIKQSRMQENQEIEKLFKPISSPLQELVQQKEQTNKFTTNSNEDDENEIKTETKYDSDDAEMAQEKIFKYLYGDGDDTDTRNNKRDKLFGIRVVKDGYKIGDSKVLLLNGKIVVQDDSYKTTNGLLELLFKEYPNMVYVTEEDLANYKSILEKTNAHRHNYKPNSRIRSSRGYKYKEIISQLFPKSKHGLGVLPLHKTTSLDSAKIDYVNWDDPNELIARLKLLLASRDAGHTGHDNEILSIIEELREAHIIV